MKVLSFKHVLHDTLYLQVHSFVISCQVLEHVILHRSKWIEVVGYHLYVNVCISLQIAGAS